MFDSKFNQWMFAIAIGFIALACYWGKKNNSPEALRVEQDFSYEMPRPKSTSPDFDISGRSIIRKTETIKNSIVTSKAALPPAAVAAATAEQRGTAAAAAKKLADDQKKKTEEAKKKTEEAARRAKANVNIAKSADGHDTPMTRIADSGSSASSGSSAAYGAPPPPADQTPVAVGSGSSSSSNSDSPQLSSSQWQALLMNSPTAANGAEFLAAYRTKAVTAAAFYQIASALLADSNKDRQTLGFTLLQQTPSLKSFTALVDNSATTTDATLKAKETAALASYGSASQFGVLAQALYSTDAKVLSAATDLINMALSTESSQGTGSSGGSSATAQQFQIFVPGLRQLASSTDPNVAAQAQTLLNSILALHA